MCLLTYIPPDTMPDTEALYNGSVFNDNGHGFAIVCDDHIIVMRGMNSEQMIDTFALLRKMNPQGPALFHSRLATHGATDVKNCHPFYVGHDPRIVVAHNGILPKSCQPDKTDNRSDTAIFAYDVLSRNPFGSLDSRKGRKRIERWLTPYNKLVILSVHPKLKNSAYIFNENQGFWDDGIWYSNDGYLPYVYTTKSYQGKYYTPGSYTEGYSSDPCIMCGAIGSLDYVLNVCKWCNSCIDCGEDLGDCLCRYADEKKAVTMGPTCPTCKYMNCICRNS